MTPLSPLSFPLLGQHLIEASAGTGKTYTIALLYVRLILGHGGDHGFTRPLLPPDILVVTFTEAATMELRDRIRARLTQAAWYFRQDGHEETNNGEDDALYSLRAAYPCTDWSRHARQLELAAQWMDEAAISTIHAWCHRMLKEHAFDCQSTLVQELNTHTHEWLDEAVRDYWRIFYYPLAEKQLSTLLTYWENPVKLAHETAPFLRYTSQLPNPTEPPQAILAQTQEAKAQILAILKAPWLDWADELQQLLDQAKEQKLFDGRKLNAKYYTAWLKQLRQWATDDSDQPCLSDAAWQRLTPVGIGEAWRDTPPHHPAFEAIIALKQALTGLPDARAALLAHATHWLTQQLDNRRQQSGQMGFDDLLSDLHHALISPHGIRLAEVIRQQFPVALIDEFQDTDPIQYQIFERVYVAGDPQGSGLILIGDPKQAIYRFRGADIYTYLAARQAVGPQRYSLTTNFRATHAIVTSLNHLFNRLEQHPSAQGAFLFQQEGDNPIPYVTIQAKGRPLEAWMNDRSMPAQTWVLHDPHAALGYAEQMAETCAQTIVTWLTMPAGYKGPSSCQAVTPKDMAILVNNRQQALLMRQALARRGVRSVYGSDKGSVYQTPQAVEIQRWLIACASPTDEGKLRTALATPSLGLTWTELEAIYHDEEQAESRLMQFRGYQRLWQTQGILPMMRRLMQDFHCYDRLLCLRCDSLGQSGERILTDLLHLAELLQQTSFDVAGEHALLRHLADQIANPDQDDKGPDGQRLRLESEEGLVQVVTIHKSKGLEYPFVFLPFISACRPVKPNDQPLTWHDAEGTLQLDLQPNDEALERAEQERLAEDMRKLYVALTRAQYCIWLGIDLKVRPYLSAIDRLLGRCNPLDPDLTEDHLLALADGQSITIISHSSPDNSVYHPPAPSDHQAMGSARRAHRPEYEPWVISSYSTLVYHPVNNKASPWLDDSSQLTHLTEYQQDASLTLMASSVTDSPWHQFPKGALAGTLFHDVMEWVAQMGFGALAKNPDQRRAGIALRCQLRGWDTWVDTLKDWLGTLLTQPMLVGQETISLHQLVEVKGEVEFWFAADHVDLLQLDDLVIRHTLGARSRPTITAGLLNGLLKGFMDLVFEHHGRYYVADYKTNWLGPSDACYSAAAMEDAMASHRYDLQSLLYLLALHRLLRARLPDYDYERHMGGALYLFVRGIESTTRGVHVERPPKYLIQQLDALFAGNQGAVQGAAP